MQIVWDADAVEQLKKNQTLLELETFVVKGKPVTTYCVVPAEKLLMEMAQLTVYTDLHAGFISAFNDKNYTVCVDAAEHLMGRFGGELDSFYEEILNRIKLT